MSIREAKVILPGIHQCISLTNDNWELSKEGQLTPTGDEIILLLHGYSESAHKIYKRIGRSLDQAINKSDKRYSIIALNGLYPLPKHFPLDGKRDPHEDLLAGFAWYFYDQREDKFLIDYSVPVATLTSFLKEINSHDLPTSIMGYSQGGYLAPFVGLAYGPTKQVMGINCSFRFDLIKDQYESIPFALNQVQGSEDEVIDRELSHKRYEQLNQFYKIKGSFQWVEEANHWLTPHTRDAAIALFKEYL